ncbi:unnamed protein product, partial [Amoebophrya sp. A25]|eukprot:GSA25T00018391001.1
MPVLRQLSPPRRLSGDGNPFLNNSKDMVGMGKKIEEQKFSQTGTVEDNELEQKKQVEIKTVSGRGGATFASSEETDSRSRVFLEAKKVGRRVGITPVHDFNNITRYELESPINASSVNEVQGVEFSSAGTIFVPDASSSERPRPSWEDGRRGDTDILEGARLFHEGADHDQTTTRSTPFRSRSPKKSG